MKQIVILILTDVCTAVTHRTFVRMNSQVTETEIRDAFATACMELGHVDEGRCVLRGNTFRWVIATKAAYPTE